MSKNDIITTNSSAKFNTLIDSNSTNFITKANSFQLAVDNGFRSIDDYILEIMNKYNIKPTNEYKCVNCGGVINLDIEKHIFHCPYCNSVYAIGTEQVNSI